MPGLQNQGRFVSGKAAFQSWRIAAYVFLVLLAADNLLGVSYTVEGTLTYKSSADPTAPLPKFSAPEGLPPNMVEGLRKAFDQTIAEQTNTVPETGAFVLHYTDCMWNLSIFTTGGTNAYPYYYVYDGTNLVYYLLPGSDSAALGSGMIESTPVPRIYAGALGAAVWMAFASECELDRITNDMIPWLEPIFSSSGFSKRFEVPCRLVRSTSDPHLLKEAFYTFTNFPHLGTSGTILTNSIKAPFQNGYIRAEFKALNFTNFDMLSFPTSFNFKQFAPEFQAKTNTDLFNSVEVTCIVTNVVVGSWTWEDPRIGRRIYVQDLRAPVANVLFLLTNEVPPLNAAIVINAEKRAARMIPFNETSLRIAKTSRSIFGVVVIMILLLLVILFFFMRRRAAQKPR